MIPNNSSSRKNQTVVNVKPTKNNISGKMGNEKSLKLQMQFGLEKMAIPPSPPQNNNTSNTVPIRSVN